MKNSKIEQTENSIIQTVVDGIWKSILTQINDKEGHMHIVKELFKGEELIERKEWIFWEEKIKYI